MRRHCQRLKVVDKPLNGAHIVVPPASSGEVTLAVRAYYAKDIPPHLPEASSLFASDDDNDFDDDGGDSDADLDELVHFQNAFALTIVLFILPEEEHDNHYENIGSFFNRATLRLAMTNTLNPSSAAQMQNGNNHTTRVMMVPSTESAVETLVHFANALAPPKRQLKQAFYDHMQQMHLIPPLANTPAFEPAATASVRIALREWAREHNVQEQDADIVMDVLGSLETIVQHAATGFPTVPVEMRTKELLQDFFCAEGASSMDDDYYDNNDPNQLSLMSSPELYPFAQQEPPQPAVDLDNGWNNNGDDNPPLAVPVPPNDDSSIVHPPIEELPTYGGTGAPLPSFLDHFSPQNNHSVSHNPPPEAYHHQPDSMYHEEEYVHQNFAPATRHGPFSKQQQPPSQPLYNSGGPYAPQPGSNLQHSNH